MHTEMPGYDKESINAYLTIMKRIREKKWPEVIKMTSPEMMWPPEEKWQRVLLDDSEMHHDLKEKADDIRRELSLEKKNDLKVFQYPESPFLSAIREGAPGPVIKTFLKMGVPVDGVLNKQVETCHVIGVPSIDPINLAVTSRNAEAFVTLLSWATREGKLLSIIMSDLQLHVFEALHPDDTNAPSIEESTRFTHFLLVAIDQWKRNDPRSNVIFQLAITFMKKAFKLAPDLPSYVDFTVSRRPNTAHPMYLALELGHIDLLPTIAKALPQLTQDALGKSVDNSSLIELIGMYALAHMKSTTQLIKDWELDSRTNWQSVDQGIQDAEITPEAYGVFLYQMEHHRRQVVSAWEKKREKAQYYRAWAILLLGMRSEHCAHPRLLEQYWRGDLTTNHEAQSYLLLTPSHGAQHPPPPKKVYEEAHMPDKPMWLSQEALVAYMSQPTYEACRIRPKDSAETYGNRLSKRFLENLLKAWVVDGLISHTSQALELIVRAAAKSPSFATTSQSASFTEKEMLVATTLDRFLHRNPQQQKIKQLTLFLATHSIFDEMSAGKWAQVRNMIFEGAHYPPVTHKEKIDLQGQDMVVRKALMLDDRPLTVYQCVDSPLLCAIRQGAPTNIIESLLKHGVRIDGILIRQDDTGYQVYVPPDAPINVATAFQNTAAFNTLLSQAKATGTLSSIITSDVLLNIFDLLRSSSSSSLSLDNGASPFSHFLLIAIEQWNQSDQESRKIFSTALKYTLQAVDAGMLNPASRRPDITHAVYRALELGKNELVNATDLLRLADDILVEPVNGSSLIELIGMIGIIYVDRGPIDMLDHWQLHSPPNMRALNTLLSSGSDTQPMESLQNFLIKLATRDADGLPPFVTTSLLQSYQKKWAENPENSKFPQEGEEPEDYATRCVESYRKQLQAWVDGYLSHTITPEMLGIQKIGEPTTTLHTPTAETEAQTHNVATNLYKFLHGQAGDTVDPKTTLERANTLNALLGNPKSFSPESEMF